MITKVQDHLQEILTTYSQGERYNEMKRAIDVFAKLTGKLDEDAENFEARMNSFNDWFVFNYIKENNHTVVEDYIMESDISSNLVESLLGINYSLFLFSKVSFRKKIILKDILHDDKVSVSLDNSTIGLVENDLFVGRILTFDGEKYLLNGATTMPGDTLSILKKEAKKIRKLNSKEEEANFLIKLEEFKTKSLHYAHVDNSKIFTFS